MCWAILRQAQDDRYNSNAVHLGAETRRAIKGRLLYK